MSDQGSGQVRSTRQRRAVSSALNDLDGFRSAQQIHELLRSRGDKVGLTTVYRTLQAMAEAEEVDVLRAGDGEALYRQCASGGHHHHLVCRGCRLTVEVEGPAVESWADRLATANGFSDVSHTLEIFGLCATCSSRGM